MYLYVMNKKIKNFYKKNKNKNITVRTWDAIKSVLCISML